MRVEPAGTTLDSLPTCETEEEREEERRSRWWRRRRGVVGLEPKRKHDGGEESQVSIFTSLVLLNRDGAKWIHLMNAPAVLVLLCVYVCVRLCVWLLKLSVCPLLLCLCP